MSLSGRTAIMWAPLRESDSEPDEAVFVPYEMSFLPWQLLHSEYHLA